MIAKLFLLGGHDLEMSEIAKLLESRGCRKIEKISDATDRNGCYYADAGLSWGNALLGTYGDLLDFEGDIYGIELQEDIEPPKNYHRIDHHGTRAHLPSAIEQVATILGVELNRYQKLVATNDRGYIPAMRCLCATEEEIRQIREADRKAQGVTDEEEKRAEMEVRWVAERNGIYLLKTSLDHFSPLIDRIPLYKRPLIVENGKMLSVYGDDLSELTETLKETIEKREAYAGGGVPPTFFGLTEAYFINHGMDETVEKIASLLESGLYSYHIFMFPFRIGESFDEENIDTGEWKRKDFSIRSPEAYNVQAYFYPYVRKVLGLTSENEKAISQFFEYAKGGNGIYHIRAKGKSYELELDGIFLRIFKNEKTGILSFHLKNVKYPEPDDVLRINDFGRRIFPQFIGNHMTCDAKNAFLSCEVGLVFDDGTAWIEDFSHYDTFDTLTSHRYVNPRHIRMLLRPAKLENVEPIIDDRMYVVSHFMHDESSAALKAYDAGTKRYAYEENPFWYKFVFVDTDLMCQNKNMLPECIKESTYARWIDYGTIFGVSRYSFMLLTDRSSFSRNILDTHIRTVYFQMVTLLLSYRAMILAFSSDVGAVADETSYARKLEKSEKIFKDYIRFENHIYFKEVTAQEQGIELFDLARERMRLDDRLVELDHDIAELHEFIQMKQNRREEKNLNSLNTLAGLFLPATVISGIFGMNIFPEKWNTLLQSPVMVAIVTIVTIAVTIGLYMHLNMKGKEK